MRKAGKPKKEEGETTMHQDSLNDLEAARPQETTKVPACSKERRKSIPIVSAMTSSSRCRCTDVLFSARGHLCCEGDGG